jgi:hypothetical protein
MSPACGNQKQSFRPRKFVVRESLWPQVSSSTLCCCYELLHSSHPLHHCRTAGHRTSSSAFSLSQEIERRAMRYFQPTLRTGSMIHWSVDCNLYNNHLDSGCKSLLSPSSPCCVGHSKMVCCRSNLQCCTLCVRPCGRLEIYSHHQ